MCLPPPHVHRTTRHVFVYNCLCFPPPTSHLVKNYIEKLVFYQRPFGGKVSGAGIGVTAVTLLFSNNFMLAYRGAKNLPQSSASGFGIFHVRICLCSGMLTMTSNKLGACA